MKTVEGVKYEEKYVKEYMIFNTWIMYFTYLSIILLGQDKPSSYLFLQFPHELLGKKTFSTSENLAISQINLLNF